MLPILYGDRLVARFEPKLDRAGRTLAILGFCLEQDTRLDERHKAAFAAALRRFAHFVGADQITWGPAVSQAVVDSLQPLAAIQI